ncbi:hypothetical protein DRP05_01730 [Archaeoglobales archaeon]|nr:MAG: hypothetical protein DRP05_01730 [Archaeoglobales archaeon]
MGYTLNSIKDESKKEFLKQIYLLKGLDNKLNTNLFENEEKMKIAEELMNELLNNSEDLREEQKREVLNRLLLVLDLETLNSDFYSIIFGDLDFSKIDELKKRVHNFRCLCFLVYGRFRGGYRKFVENTEILREKLSEFFPDKDERLKRKERLQDPKRELVGFKEIPPELRFCLGYLAKKEFPEVSEYRKS